VEVDAGRRAHVKGVADPLVVYPLLGLRETREPGPDYPGDAAAEPPILSA
jgi:hypothetical protein